MSPEEELARDFYEGLREILPENFELPWEKIPIKEGFISVAEIVIKKGWHK